MPAVNVTDDTRIGWKPNPLERGSFELLYTCLATILACTFAVLHLNVPNPNDTFFRIFLRKFQWMLIAALGPEIVTGLAMGDFAASRRTEAMRALGSTNWTTTHSYFANMGGFIVYPVSGKPFPATTRILEWLIENGHMAAPTITLEQIRDRSKADVFSKGFACLQALWLVVDCVMRRVVYKLPISELELATCAFVLCMLITYICWWNKPKDVEAAEKIYLHGQLNIHEIRESLGMTIEEWDKRVNNQRIENYAWGVMRGGESTYIRVGWMVVGIIFNIIHCLAWNFSFPTREELWAWRLTSAFSAFAFVFALFVYIIVNWFKIWRGAPLWIWAIGPVTYVLARIGLIILMFTCLRSLPVGVYRKVNWADAVPHL
ncbi:hypothetical protein BDN72DRAFT_818699 [Pluteus cervinus]|uniref:Uncharacterized protein n=1 Tax=Pluteus cervinus TaxID=181527 RepID=A0ACD3AY14_9AGAR|nr:hypothetical protein BDN72DRAFT_818699 [Pluteus cervinus]